MDPVAIDRYARALFNAAKKAGEAEKVESDMVALKAHIRQSGLKSFLDNPRFPRAVKLSTIDRIGAMFASKLSVSFLRLLLIRSRTQLLEGVADRFVELNRESKGIVFCDLVLAAEPSKDFLVRMENELERITHLDVEMRVKVDPAVLGGVRLKIKNRVLDGTYRERLDLMRTQLLAGQYT